MPGATANLSGSGPQQVYVWLSYTSYSQSGNYSNWYRELVYKNNGGLQWINDGNTWQYGGWMGSAAHGFAIPSSWAGSGDHLLNSGSFTKSHDADGYLTGGNLSATINTNHTSIGDGTATVSSGTPPRIPKAPDTPPNSVFTSADSDRVNFTVASPADNGGSSIIDYDQRLYTLSGGVYTQVAQKTTTGASQFFDGLDPSTQYYHRYRARNAIGSSGYTAYVPMLTEGGIFVSDGSAWKGYTTQTSDGVAWTKPTPQISDGSAWADPLDV